jgi:hypothetical protein
LLPQERVQSLFETLYRIDEIGDLRELALV